MKVKDLRCIDDIDCQDCPFGSKWCGEIECGVTFEENFKRIYEKYHKEIKQILEKEIGIHEK